MAKKKSNTAALVEHNVADEEHPDRLPLEKTWPAETQPLDEDDGTEPFGATDQRAFVNSDSLELLQQETVLEPSSYAIGLSNSGPFIAPALVRAEAEMQAANSKRPKLTVASMTREQAFSLFRDKLFELCFKYGFTLDGLDLEARDIGDAKGTAKRALAVGNHISGLGLRK